MFVTRNKIFSPHWCLKMFNTNDPPSRHDIFDTKLLDIDFYEPKQLLIFLEMVGHGCISGRVTEWPQLKPACKWAAEEIKRLREKHES